MYDSKISWNEAYKKNDIAWPAEYIIRILKGNYPNLNLSAEIQSQMKICDVGFGDGRNFLVYNQLDLDMFGVEITEEIVEKAQNHLNSFDINHVHLKVGNNKDIPFESNFFDFLVSWNSCYYMGNNTNFNDYLEEFARVLKKDGNFILSIPKETSFIYKNSEEIEGGYRIIKEDPFLIRNGETLKVFESEEDIEETFGRYFKDFKFASIHDDCFGFNYHWHLVVCKRK